MDSPTKLIIADDHPIFREGLVRAIDRDGTFVVIGQAGDGEKAWKLIEDLRPDLAVLDISMPVMDGLAIARKVNQEALPTEMVVLTMYKETAYFNAALDLGVRGYLIKDSAATELLTCLQAVREGQYYISPVVSHLLIERERRLESLPVADFRERLTPAEMAVLKLIAGNHTSKEMAETLFVSVRTVENHRLHICRKLGIKGHNKLLQFALENRSTL